MTDLLFKRPQPVGHPVDLVFGQPIGPVQDAAGRLEIVLPAASPSFGGRLEYDNAVSRSDVVTAGSAWQVARPVAPASTTATHARGAPVRILPVAPWSRGERLALQPSARWRQLRSTAMPTRAAWRPAKALAVQATANAWQPGRPTQRSAEAPWQPAAPLPAAIARSPSRVAIIVRRPPTTIPWGRGLPSPILIAASAQSADRVPAVLVAAPWQWATWLRPGRTPRPVTPPPEPWRCYTPPPGGAVHLLFSRRATAGADFLFSCGRSAPSGAIIIPALRVYIVINSASLTRVSNNLPLPVTSLSIAIDVDSAHWTWSATLPLQALADLEPDAPGEPIELEAVVNGHAWRLLVERLAESERFGQASLQIGGRGIAAELSDPIYPVVSHGNPDAAAMAQQLAAASLTINGVPLGWGLDWTAADWLVPAGAWVHRGTPLDAVARIAAAAGAYVQAAPAARSLRIRPRYPLAPWDWASAAPDIVLPAAAVMERGTEHTTRPAYDAVYVSGEAGGVLARVKRGGFAGNTPAPMVVDALVTHADAARGRGLEVLGNTGAQRIMTLETGILPASGVIHVGSLLDWTRGPQVARGLVRSLAVSATAGNSDAPVKVRQTVRVEVHD